MSDWSLRAALPTSEVDLKVFRAISKNIPKILKEEIVWHLPTGICVGKKLFDGEGSFFAKANEKVSNALVSGGIPQYWFRYLLDFEMKALENDPNEPKVFSIEGLNIF